MHVRNNSLIENYTLTKQLRVFYLVQLNEEVYNPYLL